jgi:Domain of unknown function DUF59.
MTVTEPELRERLAEIEDPLVGDDIVSLGLINDISIKGGRAGISVAFNTPYAPAEMDLGKEIREVVTGAGLEPQIDAAVTAEQGFDQEVFPNIRNVVAVASGKAVSVRRPSRPTSRRDWTDWVPVWDCSTRTSTGRTSPGCCRSRTNHR